MANRRWSSHLHGVAGIALYLLFLWCSSARLVVASVETRERKSIQQTFWSDLWRDSSASQTGAKVRRRLQLARSVETDIVNKATTFIPRRDPLAGFGIFTGGFNVTDRHYWSSVAFTGVWGYTLAVVCLIFGLLTFVWHCCCWIWGYKRSRKKGHLANSEMFRHLQFFCVFQFTICALISVGVIYWGNENMGRELKETSHLLVDTSSKVLNQVESALGTIEAATAPLDDTDMVKQIKAGCHRLNRTAHSVGRKIDTTKIKIHTISKLVKLSLTVTASVITFLLLAGLVSTLRGWREFLVMIFALMTILLFVSWLLSSVSYVLSNVTNDACQAMLDYEKSPKNSSLSKLLPCLDAAEATTALNEARAAIKSLLSQTNTIINLVNFEEQVLAAQNNQNQTVTSLPLICDPYGPAPGYRPAPCLSGESTIETFSTDFAQYRCLNDNLTYCFYNNTPIPDSIFTLVAQAMNATADVFSVLPVLFDIMTCNFVTIAFEEMTEKHCDPLKAALNTLWIGFSAAAISMMPLQVVWIIIFQTTRNNKLLAWIFEAFAGVGGK